jgi:hypothetical protein
MAGRIESAELLTALWQLGGPLTERMPTSHGILDQALHRIKSQLPEELSSSLSFSTAAVGLRCLELPDILLAAQEAMLTSEPNPTYLATDVTLDEGGARQIVVEKDMSTRQARVIGQALREAVAQAREEIGEDLEPVAA